jgi:hypothetical protein
MQDPIVAAAGAAIAEALRSGTWTAKRHEISELFPDSRTVEAQLVTDAHVIGAAEDRAQVLRDVAHAWCRRMAATGRHSDIAAAVVRTVTPTNTYTQHNNPGSGGTVFASQGGPQNVYRQV